MHPVNIVFRKELTDGRRDRRAIFSALLFPILGPGIVYFILSTMVHLKTEAQETVIPIEGIDNAPTLVQWLREQNVQIEAFKGDARRAVKDKREKLVLIIPPDYQARYGQAKPAIVELVHDGSRTDTRETVARLQQLIRGFNARTAGLRLIVRGVIPKVMQVVDVQDMDVASKQQRAASALNFIPMYIILAAFVSGMGVAIDSSAGERERRSLEPLLINPVSRADIVTGKWLAASIFAASGMVLTAVLCITIMLHAHLDEVGLRFTVSGWQMVAMILATFPLAFLATSLQLLLGTFARSFKDAQSYMGLLMIVPAVPALFTLVYPVAEHAWMFAVPMLGQQLLLVDLLGGKAVPAMAYVYSATTCIILAFALVLVTARLIQRESIIAG